MKNLIVRALCVPFIPLLALIGHGMSQEGGERLSYSQCLKMVWAQWWED